MVGRRRSWRKRRRMLDHFDRVELPVELLNFRRRVNILVCLTLHGKLVGVRGWKRRRCEAKS